MSVSDQFNVNAPSENEAEISLADIVQFIQESWKLLLGAGILGALLGLGGSFAFANYKAELLLQNNGGFDIISWRSTEKILPNLAAEMLEKKAVPDNQVALYRKISSPAWWSKNVRVNYALTKKEAKDLAAMSKDLDSAAASILSFAITASAPSEAKALNEVREVAQFLGNGAANIAIKNLLNDYESKSIAQAASVQQKISATEIELAYLRERAKNLELLQKRYPSAANVTQQVVDPKDTGAKYLPLTTQIIAINSDINANKEGLERLNDQLNQVKTYKVFLEDAAPLMVGRYDGIDMVKNFLAVEEKLRAKTPPGDIKALQNLDAIRAQFLNIEVSFRNRLLQNTAPTVGGSGGMLKNVAIGSLIAGFLMLAFLLGRKVLRTLKSPAKS
jgi:hypothetical protein